MPAPTKRLIIEIEEGLITRIIADGVDLTDVTAIVIDKDTEGTDAEDLIPFGTGRAWFAPTDIEQASDEYSRDVRRAYDTWALS
jgi:hypothetical protein